MLVRLHTADHIGPASPVQEEQGAPAPDHRARIMRFAMGEQEDSVALRFLHHRQGMCSALLYHSVSSHGCALTSSRSHLRGLFQIIRSLTGMPLGLRQAL